MQITQYFSREQLFGDSWMQLLNKEINLGVFLPIFFKQFLKNKLRGRYKRAMF